GRHLVDPADVGARRLRRNAGGATHLDHQRRGAGGVWGAQKYAVHVQVDPNKLAARQIGINEVAQAVQDWNVNIPNGTLFGPHQSYNVQSTGQLMDASSYRPMVIAWRNGSPVRLEQVANVIDSVEDNR